MTNLHSYFSSSVLVGGGVEEEGADFQSPVPPQGKFYDCMLILSWLDVVLWSSQYSSPGLFNEDQVPWLLDMLKSDVFGGAERISRDHFMTIRGESPDKNAFWRVVSQIAVEKFNMQEVFNMKSTVRLTAIEKLGELWWR